MANSTNGDGPATQLEGRVAIVTGAARGLGFEMARGLARAGAKVLLVDVRGALLAEAEATITAEAGPDMAKAQPCDITDRGDCDAAVAAAQATFGGLDILVNNAALGPVHVEESPETKSRLFWESDPERWADVITTNVIGTFFMSRVAVVPMRAAGWGRIVNVTTSLGTLQRKTNSPYGVSKSAIEAETLIWAQDLEGSGVTVNSLIPGGAADTPFVSAAGRANAQAGRTTLIAPAVMVPPLLWLASTESDGVTGARYVGKLWDPALAPAEAAKAALEAPVLRRPEGR